jgi:ribosomal protein L32E
MGPLVPENFLCWQKEKREGKKWGKKKKNERKERKRIERKKERVTAGTDTKCRGCFDSGT